MDKKELESIIDAQENLQKRFDDLLRKVENPILKDSCRLTVGTVTLCRVAIINFTKLYLTINKMVN